jgi:ADP-heptose:LPS heptosyltransferase/glycosyltransferase involved in cell wall biosynthesis
MANRKKKKGKSDRSRTQKKHQKELKRKEKRSKLRILQAGDAQRPKIEGIKHILGGDFDASKNRVERYQKLIDEIKPADGHKRRVLFITEASYLRTGFSTYLHEVFKRLHDTGKYELAEFGSYGAPPELDGRVKEIPWKYYHNLPATPIEEAQYGTQNGQPISDNYRENQFGLWKLPYVLADFKPDIVLLHRDNWMDSYVLNKNPFRDKSLVYWMPTVDGYPQKWNWLRDYAGVDGLFAYSYFGKKVLESQSRSHLAHINQVPPLQVLDVCQPGVDLKMFRPMDKAEVKQKLGIPPHLRFVGTVMRNQPRKLFPRIIESFAMFKRRHPQKAANIFLLLHTSIPDVGWDIPEAIWRAGIQDHVVFTYLCRSCGHVRISTWIGSPAQCPNCRENTFQTPNTQFGLPPEIFSLVYNLLDVYVQGSIAEGDGMPVNEAKACGIPCLVSDYSALHEKAQNGGAIAIPNSTIYTEHETMQWRSLFDRKEMANALEKLLFNEDFRLKMSYKARKSAEEFYDWNLTAKKWEYWIDAAPIKNREETWEQDQEIKVPTTDSSPKDLGDKEFIEWCYQNILCRKGVDPGGMQTWLRVLANGGSRDKLEEHFRNIVQSDNAAKELLEDPKTASTDPIVRISTELDPDDKMRILYAIPQTAGDILISTGVIEALQRKFPEASIYVATEKQFFELLEGCPHVKKVIEYDPSMIEYRAYETWGPQKNLFDIVYNPYIVTQRIPHWIHQGLGEYLGDVYADMCNVEFGEPYIGRDDSILEQVGDEPYVVVHSQTRQDPKDYDALPDAIQRIKDIRIVQIGGKDDRPLENADVQLQGKTTWQQTASLIENATLYVGLDSAPMHIASIVGTPAVIVFGGTYAKQGVNPRSPDLITVIETPDRGPCHTSCHLIDCAVKQHGFDKCINNIPVERVLEAIREKLGDEHVEPLEPVTISAYMIIKDGVKYGFPFEESIRAAVEICDEVVIVDGGSTDDTEQVINKLIGEKDGHKIVKHHHKWDMDNPTLFGDEKAYARSLCTGSHLIQLDADEILHEPKPGFIRQLVSERRFDELVDLPVINFYGDDETIRIENPLWKWRISKNDINITHGVHAEARIMDPETMQISMDKKKSDSCEYIYADSLQIVPHRPGFPVKILGSHMRVLRKENGAEGPYLEELKDLIANHAVVFHYSWMDLERKQSNGAFWDNTYHGKQEKTHNTTKDIAKRIEDSKDILLKVDFDHPMKE